MSKRTEPLPGTSDILPGEAVQWRALEAYAHEVFAVYGYGELRTPVFERTEVFLRTIGDETDIVQKEMYTFEDRGGRSLTLRPEGTAGVMRALANLGFGQGDEHRVYYLGPMFRGERPAAGRKRQFHQVGVECVGKSGPELDAETIEMLMRYLGAIGLKQTRLLLNTRGVAEDRVRAAAVYRDFFSGRVAAMCEDCRRRLESNVWRILDCKVEGCAEIAAGAPGMTELLGDASRDYFARVCACLESLGVPYALDARMIRGLDYYEHTVFEVVHEGIGAQSSVAGGGRYLIQPPGCKAPVPGVGFAAGMERLLLALAEEGAGGPDAGNESVDCYLVGLGAEALRANLALARTLRDAGLRVLANLEDRGMKSQMRNANKVGARHVLIRGGDELARGVVVCKDMVSSEQRELAVERVSEALAR